MPRSAGSPSDSSRGPRRQGRSRAQQVLAETRLRLIGAMIGSVGARGYRLTTVADVIARAGVSRKTFYEHFANKQECFLASYDLVLERAMSRIALAYSEAEGWPGRAEATISALFAAAVENPSAARLTMVEIGALGSVGVERRERALATYERFVRDAMELAQGRGTLSDTAARAIIGGINTVIYSRVSSGRHSELAALVPDLVRWATCYYPTPSTLTRARRSSGHGERARMPGGRAPGSLAPHAPLRIRRGLPGGDQNVSAGFVAHSQCERILDAVANLTAAKGYIALKVDDIAEEAAISLQAFYANFTDKEDAFLTAYELGHRRALTAVERAYATQPDWPHAVHAGIAALFAFLASEPAFAHMALVDAPVASPGTVERLRASVNTLARLLLSGVEETPAVDRPPPIATDAITGGIFELCLHPALHGRMEELPALAGDATFIALAPFLGAEEATRIAGSPSQVETEPPKGRAKGGPPRGADSRSASSAGRRGPAATERRIRLALAMIEAVAENGYGATRIADVTGRAGLSRSTFYRHFASMDECMLFTFDLVADEGMRRVEAAYRDGEGWPGRVEDAIRAFFQAAIENPGALRLTLLEIGAVGAAGTERRERSILGYERFLQDALQLAPGEGAVSEMTLKAVVGGINRVLYGQVLRGSHKKLLALVPALVTWATAYYPTPPQILSEPRSGIVGGRPLTFEGGRAPGTLTHGAHLGGRHEEDQSPSFVAHRQRELILDAIANLVAAAGYAALSVEDIAREASVSPRVFYEHFEDAEDAFLVAFEVGHGKLLALVERAYAAESDWRLSVRAAIEVLFDFLASEPSFAQMALLDALIATPRTAERSHLAVAAFARMLVPGLEEAPAQNPPAAVTIDAIASGVFDLCLHYAQQDRIQDLPELTVTATYFALAPFLGGEEAARVASASGASTTSS